MRGPESAIAALSVATAVVLGGCRSAPLGAGHTGPESRDVPGAGKDVAPSASVATSATPTPPEKAEPPPAPLVLPAPKFKYLLRHSGDVFALAFDPSSTMLVAGDRDRHVKMWSPVDGQLLHDRTEHKEGVTAVAFRPDGVEFVSGGFDGTWKTWNPKIGQYIQSHLGFAGGVQSVAYSPDGHRFATGGPGGQIELFDLTQQKMADKLSSSGGAVMALAFAHHHDWLLSRADGGVLTLWDVSRLSSLHEIRAHAGAVWHALFTPDDRYLVTTWEPTSGTAAVGIWDAETGQHVQDLPVQSFLAPSVALSADGRLLAVGTAKGTVELWDFPARTRLFELSRFKRNVLGLAFSPNDKYLAAGGYDDAIAVWEISR